MEIKLEDVKRIEVEGEIENIGYIRLKNGEGIFFEIISREKFDNIIEGTYGSE